MTRTLSTASTLALLGLLLGLSCGDEPGARCGAVCARFRDCVSGNYDVAACESRCEKAASDDRDHARRVDNCMACIEGRACTDAVRACPVDCLGIVP